MVRVGLDGTLLEGELPPIQGAVVARHTAMYDDQPEAGCLVHTHSRTRRPTPELAITVGGVAEEAAQAGIDAAALGGPVEIAEDMRAAALQRSMAFADRGAVRA